MAMKLLAILLMWWGASFFIPVLMASPLGLIFGVLLIVCGILILLGR